MTLIPTPEYVRTYGSRVFKNTFLQTDKFLSGDILYHDLEGNFYFGMRYENGKAVAKISKRLGTPTAENTDAFQLAVISNSYSVTIKPQLKQLRKSDEDWSAWGIPLNEVVVVWEKPEDTNSSDPWDNSGSDDDYYYEPDPILGDDYYFYMNPDNWYSGNNSSGNSEPNKYVPSKNDKVVTGTFTHMRSIQTGNSMECATFGMQILDRLFGGSRSHSFFTSEYNKLYGGDAYNYGMSISGLKEFLGGYFVTTESRNPIELLMQGMPVMISLKDISYYMGSESPVVHNVVVVGYTEMAEYIYMNPEVGYLQKAPQSDFSNRYIIGVSGYKQ